MNDLTKKNGSAIALPDDFADQLGAGIAESRAQTQLSGGGGKPFLSLIKGDGWVFGPEKEEVQDGSWWIVNVMTFAHGWSCWVETPSKRELKGEVMDSMARSKPVKPMPIDGQEFKEQRSFELKCLNGDHEGADVIYKNSSDGGVKAAIALAGEVQKRLAVRENRAYPCPVVQLDYEYYDHPKYSRVYKPIFTIVGWANMMGELEGAARPLAMDEGAAPAPAPAPKAPTTTLIKPRKAAAPPVGTVAGSPVDAPAPTQRQHVGQRRRPAAR
jgi:hypothetical protein